MTRLLMILSLIVGVAGLHACASGGRSTASDQEDGFKPTHSDVRGRN